MPVSKQGVSIVIPVLNESSNLRILVSKIKKNLKKFTYEIIFIDDNSTDNSRKILEDLRTKNYNLRFYIRKNLPDLSKSCQLGFDKSKYQNIIVMDGDLQHNPKYLSNMINSFMLNNCDFLIATRNFKKEYISHLRFILSILIIKIINLLLGSRTKDPMSGFFIFKKKIYNINKKNLYGTGFKILFDLLYVEKKIPLINEFKFKFNARKRNKSKMNLRILFILIKMIFFYLSKNNFFNKFKL